MDTGGFFVFNGGCQFHWEGAFYAVDGVKLLTVITVIKEGNDGSEKRRSSRH